MQKRLSCTDRIKVAVSGEVKAFIPSLSSIDGMDGVPLATLNIKPEQLRTNIGWVYAANSAIVDDVSAATLKLYKLRKDGDREEIDQHPILELLENPMLEPTGEMMRSLFHTYRNMVGEAYLLMVKGGSPMEVKRGVLADALQVLPAHLVDLKLGENRYTNSRIKYGTAEYKVDQVIRGFVPDPGNPYYGRSIIAAASAAIDTDQQMQSCARVASRPPARRPRTGHQDRPIDTALRRLARRHRQLSEEISDADRELTQLAGEVAPDLLALAGVGPEVAGQLLTSAGDNPDRITSEAAFAHLCGVAPVPASSGRIHRHRLNRGGDRQANNALYIVVLNRLRYDPRSRAYAQTPHPRRTVQTRDHQMLEALRRPPDLPRPRTRSSCRKPGRFSTYQRRGASVGH